MKKLLIFVAFVFTVLPLVYFTDLRYYALPVQAASYKTAFVQTDLLQHYNAKYNIRLAGKIAANDRLVGLVEFYDSDQVVQKSMTVEEIRALGWSVSDKPYGFELTKDNYTIRATSAF